jgi:hypothetical protein
VSTPRSARATYKQRIQRARTLLATIQALLDEHALAHVREPDRWDLVGDLGALNDKLGEAAATLGRDREQGGSEPAG